LVILGASGDLARRKLLPALYNLSVCGAGAMPHSTAVVGFARTRMTTEEFRKAARESIDQFSRLKVEEPCWQQFVEGLDYVSGLDQPDGFEHLRARLLEIEASRGLPGSRIFYLSVPPEAIRDAIERLKAARLVTAPGAAQFSRVVVEKPIGHDFKSALEINRALRKHLSESQIFRIDHYLGKETVRNLLVLRFANTIYERLWGARNVDHVQLTVAEEEGVGTRAGYYDRAGALRDMVQNHMLQLLALLAMEPPVSLEASAIRESKLNVIEALRPMRPDQARTATVRAHYTSGLIDNKQVPGYLDEPGVAEGSRTETFAALKVWVDNWRWSGVPFYLRTGKRMPTRASTISVQFKDVPQILFNRNASLPANVLTLRIQPDEGFSFDVVAKQPGLDLALKPVRMNLSYQTAFGGPSPDAYERLLLDVMQGDHTLFPSETFVAKSWEFVQGILDAWSDGSRVPLGAYPAGSWGPQQADELVASGGRKWYRP
jgi:glucose-6-phosphate 1-dehydrogenase